MESDEDWLNESSTEVVALPAQTVIPTDYASRLALVESCWQRLSVSQRAFLTAWRDCRFNARAANRTLHGRSETNASHTKWCGQADYATVMQVWRANAAADALDRDRLLARHDDIVETALTPKPVIHQGIMVRDTRPGAAPDAVLEEVDVGAARSANADLLQAAGVLKTGKDVDVNVGVVVNMGPPTLNIQVMPVAPSHVKNTHVVVDAKFTEVPSEEDGWLDA